MGPPAQLTPGQTFAGGHLIEGLLAEGGMGTLYVVRHLATGQRRALKLMRPQLLMDPKMVERFLLESRVSTQVHSEHVVHVLDSGVDAASGAPWFSMELLEGETLEQHVRSRGALPVAEARHLLAQLCEALGKAHASHLVHRDLKPENLLLARAPSGVVLKVLDFGIAKVLHEGHSLALSSGILGTPLWMAPEQLGADPVGPRTDVFALGLLAFYMLTGHHYWRAAEQENPLQGVLAELLDGAPLPASARAAELGVALPPGFDLAFARCTARDAKLRPHDATAAAELLLPLLEPASASPALAATLVAPSPAALPPTRVMPAMPATEQLPAAPPPPKAPRVTRTAPMLAPPAFHPAAHAHAELPTTRPPSAPSRGASFWVPLVLAALVAAAATFWLLRG